MYVDMGSKCVCCDICLKTCACGLCNEKNSFIFLQNNLVQFNKSIHLLSLYYVNIIKCKWSNVNE